MFVDQPVGTGFSYADHGEYVVRSRFLDPGLYELDEGMDPRAELDTGSSG